METLPSQDVRFRRLYQAHRNAIVAYCSRRVGRTDAADAAAETFAVAWRRIDDMPKGEAELSWLYAVAYRVISNQRRAAVRQRALRTKLAGTAVHTPDGPEHQVVQYEDHQRLIDALDSLPPADSELLRLVTWEEHPRDLVADLLGINRAALDQRLHRAVKRLSNVYQPAALPHFTPKAAEGGER